jgi:riboflavin transporter FmnP
VTKSQRKATILGRLAGMAASIYFWFILNNYGSTPLAHQSLFAAMLEDENMDTLTVLGITVVSTIIFTIFTGLICRLLFSFGDDE